MINFSCIDALKNCTKNNMNNVNYYNVCMNAIKCFTLKKRQDFKEIKTTAWSRGPEAV